MNHDYCHCFDYDKSCPESCFRAELERDLRKPEMIAQLKNIPLSYAHLRDTKMCERKMQLSAKFSPNSRK